MADDNERRKKKKIEQNDPNGEVVKSRKADLRCGHIHTISVWQPTVIIDSHMHIQSGHCAPLQYVQSLSAVTSVMSRGWIEGSGSLGGHFLEILFEPVAAIKRAVERASSEDPPNPQEGFFRASPVRQLSEKAEKSTNDIGADFMLERKNVLENYFQKHLFYAGAPNLLFCSVIMTMDMEYAHIDGYFGIPVYNALYKREEDIADNKPVAYWTPQHGHWKKADRMKVPLTDDLPYRGRGSDLYVKLDKDGSSSLRREDYEKYEKSAVEHGLTGTYYNSRAHTTREVRINAIPVLLPDSETKKYENWRMQLMHTEHAVLSNPLKLLPMFHYDPRRWQPLGNDEPMSKVISTPEKPEQAIYLGFKMYTSQGYRPWDPRLPILEDFYAKCCNHRIPNHESLHSRRRCHL
jgi:hypothetical protein